MIRWLPLLAMLACAKLPASALDHPTGWALPTDSEGRLEGFREVLVHAEPWADALSPSADAIDGRGDLTVENTHSAWAWIGVNGDRAGKVKPFGTVVIRDLPAGAYKVSLTLPNGYVREKTVRVNAG